MQIPQLTEEIARELRAQHAHRHPQRAALQVPGDGGAPQTLVVVLGTPSGACSMPPDQKPAAAWRKFFASALGMQAETEGLGRELVNDCVLWPERAVVDAWLVRWGGLPKSIADAVAKKIAAVPSVVSIPDPDDEPPAALRPVLEQHPRATWRVVRPTSKEADAFAVVLDPPEAAAWKLFQAALKQPKGDHWASVRDMAMACTRGAARLADGAALDPAERMAVYVGLPVIFIGALGELVGATAEVELGEL